MGVVVQSIHGAEARPQRRGHQRQPCGGTHEREARQIQADGTSRRPFADHDVERVLFHRRIQDFLDHTAEAVNLIDEQDISGAQAGENCRQISGPLNGRSGGHLDADAHLVGNDVGQRGLAQSRRPVEKNMIERVTAATRRADQDLEVLLELALTNDFGQGARPQRMIDAIAWL